MSNVECGSVTILLRHINSECIRSLLITYLESFCSFRHEFVLSFILKFVQFEVYLNKITNLLVPFLHSSFVNLGVGFNNVVLHLLMNL